MNFPRPSTSSDGLLSPSTASSKIETSPYRAAMASVQSHFGFAITARSGAKNDVTWNTSHVITTMNMPAVASTSLPVNATITGRTPRLTRPRIMANTMKARNPESVRVTIGTRTSPNGNGCGTWISDRRKASARRMSASTNASNRNRRTAVSSFFPGQDRDAIGPIIAPRHALRLAHFVRRAAGSRPGAESQRGLGPPISRLPVFPGRDRSDHSRRRMNRLTTATHAGRTRTTQSRNATATNRTSPNR